MVVKASFLVLYILILIFYFTIAWPSIYDPNQNYECKLFTCIWKKTSKYPNVIDVG
jgi:hypothetical protein